MTPQEQELLSELFDRLAKSETNPRDLDAERMIADGLRRAPHAVYALVQTALVQDEALKRANGRIEELQAQGVGQEQQGGGSFLDSMRDAVLGRTEPRASAPPAPSYRPQPQYPPQASALLIFSPSIVLSALLPGQNTLYLHSRPLAAPGRRNTTLVETGCDSS
jgi:uncharacterized protein